MLYSNQGALGLQWRSKGEEMLVLMRRGHGSSDLVRSPAMDIKRRARLVQVCLRFCWARQKKTVTAFTVRKWMRAEHHTFQSNGGKQRGFRCLVREKKKEWEKPELKSLQRRLFAEKCQRSHYPICTERAKQSKRLSFSACTHTPTLPALWHTVSSEIRGEVLFNMD